MTGSFLVSVSDHSFEIKKVVNSPTFQRKACEMKGHSPFKVNLKKTLVNVDRVKALVK
jgi:hypothetical protein